MHTHGSDCEHDGRTRAGAGDRSARALTAALVVTLLVLVAEAVGGWLANSLALLADAGHMLTDAAALSLSLFVAWFSRQPVTPRKTYGYLRWEILAAFINGATLLALSVWIIVEAVGRFRNPAEVGGPLMLVIAAIGLVANGIAAKLLHPLHGSSLNVRGAYLHILGDLLSSVGTLIAALVILFSGWTYADPIASLFTTALIVRGAWALVRDSVDVLLESTPAHISLAEVRAALEGITGVESVHDLHVWTVTSGVVALSAHAIVRSPDQQQSVLERAYSLMRGLGIHHVTLQTERSEIAECEMHLHP